MNKLNKLTVYQVDARVHDDQGVEYTVQVVYEKGKWVAKLGELEGRGTTVTRALLDLARGRQVGVK